MPLRYCCYKLFLFCCPLKAVVPVQRVVNFPKFNFRVIRMVLLSLLSINHMVQTESISWQPVDSRAYIWKLFPLGLGNVRTYAWVAECCLRNTGINSMGNRNWVLPIYLGKGGPCKIQILRGPGNPEWVSSVIFIPVIKYQICYLIRVPSTCLLPKPLRVKGM